MIISIIVLLILLSSYNFTRYLQRCITLLHCFLLQFNIIFMDYVMLSLFRPLEQYVVPSTFKLARNVVSLLDTVDGILVPARDIQPAT
jgi:hypothetical protein